MKKLFFMLTIIAVQFVNAQSTFDQGMGKAFGLWKEGKIAEASDMFERVAAVETSSWLPNYYVALVNTTATFRMKDKEQIALMLQKSQNVLDQEFVKDANNAELYVLQALIYTAWIVYDPMTNGQKYSKQVTELYQKAATIEPNNPRVVFGKAEFLFNGAKWSGIDTKPLCLEFERAVQLFASYKQNIKFGPTWGEDRAKEALNKCK